MGVIYFYALGNLDYFAFIMTVLVFRMTTRLGYPKQKIDK